VGVGLQLGELSAGGGREIVAPLAESPAEAAGGGRAGLLLGWRGLLPVQLAACPPGSLEKLPGPPARPGLSAALLAARRRLLGRQPLRAAARRAGILAGDRLLRIDGVAAEELTLDEVTTLLRGPAGSGVELEVARGEPGQRPRCGGWQLLAPCVRMAAVAAAMHGLGKGARCRGKCQRAVWPGRVRGLAAAEARPPSAARR
jgi:hypothetical protein